MAITHYETLGVPQTASLDEIRAAYRRLAKRHHPDIGSDESGHQRMVSLNEAYAILSEPASRHVYDRQLSGFATASLRQPEPPRRPATRSANAEDECQRWLREVYQPVHAEINRVLRPFRRQLDALAYDPYDDELVAEFTAYLERSQAAFGRAKQSFASRPNPAGAARAAEFLFHSLNHLGDALDELRYFTLNYDYQHLHIGEELLRRVEELWRQGAAAAEQLQRLVR